MICLYCNTNFLSKGFCKGKYCSIKCKRLGIKRECRRRDREWFISLKNKPCVDCGRSFPACCMDFDHIDGNKQFSVGKGLFGSKTKLLIEISKCELVCANCHRIRTEQRRNKC